MFENNDNVLQFLYVDSYNFQYHGTGLKFHLQFHLPTYKKTYKAKTGQYTFSTTKGVYGHQIYENQADTKKQVVFNN